MAINLTNEIAARAATLSPERQREALALLEQLAARAGPSVAPVPRAKRRLKGATAQGQSVSSEEIRAARREVWGEYMREDKV